MAQKSQNTNRFWSSANSNGENDSSTKSMMNPIESDKETEERLAAIFKQLDRNGTGRIDIQDLTVALKDLSGMSRQYAEVYFI